MKIFRAFTLVEMTIALVLMGIIVAALGRGFADTFSFLNYFKVETFKSTAASAMEGYMDANIELFNSDIAVIVAADDLLEHVEQGALSDLSKGPEGDDWNYLACAVRGQLHYIVSVNYCYFFAYRTESGADIPNGITITSPADQDLASWRDHADIKDIVLLSSRTSFKNALEQTETKLLNVKTALENYHRFLQGLDNIGGALLYRYAKEPLNAANASLFDADSILENTEKSGFNTFSEDAKAVLGLTDDDLDTPFGEIELDNGSAAVRSPDNGDSPPYNALLYVPAVAVTVVVSSI